MRLKLIFLAAVLLLLICGSTNLLRADDGWDGPSLTLIEENDSSLSDRNYTQGAKIQFLSGDHTNRGCFTSWLPSLGYDAPRWKWGLEAGHEIYTPEDLLERKLIHDDRPYAGWLYGGLIFQQRGTNGNGTGVMETFRLRVGVVGPDSRADDVQIWWHRTFGFDHPSGWRNQLKNEVGGEIIYDRRYRFNRGDVWAVQFLPEGGLALGNVRIDAHAGGMVRAGYNIPNEFGVGGTGRGADLGFYIFAGAFGSAVALDIFLDGNNFRDSHSVEKMELVGELRAGFAITARHIEFSATHVRRSHEFEEQDESSGFTSLALTFKF